MSEEKISLHKIKDFLTEQDKNRYYWILLIYFMFEGGVNLLRLARNVFRSST